MMEARINVSPMFARAKQRATPTGEQRTSILAQVMQRIASPAIQTLFDRIRALLSHSADTHNGFRSALLARLEPRNTAIRFGIYKWVAAVLVVSFAVRLSPILFLAPQSSAESPVTLRPTRGSVEVSLAGLWQPVTKETELTESVQLRTNDGEATVLLHDDGNIRLSDNTKISLNDLSNLPGSSLSEPTLTVDSGRLWLQSVLPDQLKGFTVSTRAGNVVLHDGSVSVTVSDKNVRVEVWDRHATVQHNGQQLVLVSGEYVDLKDGNIARIAQASDHAYRAPWIAQNLQRDAVHQRELAQIQQERRSADAGILPNSPLYPVKRAAEAVDVFLTLNPETRVQKQLAQANTRLNEAAALIAAGDSGATAPLDEYKHTLLAMASGSGSDHAVQQLVQQQVAENSAQLSAALPDDSLYVLKETVLETSAAIPNATVNRIDVAQARFVDSLDALHDAVRTGDSVRAQSLLVDLAPSLTALKRGQMDLQSDTQREVSSLLTSVAMHIEEPPEPGTAAISSSVAQSLVAYLPEPQAHVAQSETSSQTIMTDGELDAAVETTLRHIFDEYRMPQSQLNALRAEMKTYEHSPNEGPYLRRLLLHLSDGSPPRTLVRHQIQFLREHIVNGTIDTGDQPGL